MSSIRQPSRLELTRLTSVAERLYGEWQHLSAQEVLSEILKGNAFIKNPALVSSFGADSAVLLHMVSTLDTNAQIVFLDTGFHFSETLSHRDRLTKALVRRSRCDRVSEKWKPVSRKTICALVSSVLTMCKSTALSAPKLDTNAGFLMKALPFSISDKTSCADRCCHSP